MKKGKANGTIRANHSELCGRRWGAGAETPNRLQEKRENKTFYSVLGSQANILFSFDGQCLFFIVLFSALGRICRGLGNAFVFSLFSAHFFCIRFAVAVLRLAVATAIAARRRSRTEITTFSRQPRFKL